MKVYDHNTGNVREVKEGEILEDLMFMIQQSYIIEHRQDERAIQIIREKYAFID